MLLLPCMAMWASPPHVLFLAVCCCRRRKPLHTTTGKSNAKPRSLKPAPVHAYINRQPCIYVYTDTGLQVCIHAFIHSPHAAMHTICLSSLSHRCMSFQPIVHLSTRPLHSIPYRFRQFHSIVLSLHKSFLPSFPSSSCILNILCVHSAFLHSFIHLIHSIPFHSNPFIHPITSQFHEKTHSFYAFHTMASHLISLFIHLLIHSFVHSFISFILSFVSSPLGLFHFISFIKRPTLLDC